MNKLKKIVNKISHLKSVFTPADKYNELVDILNTSNDLLTFLKTHSIVSQSGLAYTSIVMQSGVLFKRGYQNITSDFSFPLHTLCSDMIKNNSDTSKTITINESIAEFITVLGLVRKDYKNDAIVYAQNSPSSFIGASFNIILDNTIGTTTHTLTLDLGTDTGLTVNGSDSLEVAAGTVGKFEVVITSATTAKVCRVY